MRTFFYIIGALFLIRLFVVMLPFALFIGGFILLVNILSQTSKGHTHYVEFEVKKPVEQSESVRETVTIPPNDTVDGVLFWIKKVQDNYRVRYQSDLYNSLIRSQAYLEKLQEHSYDSNGKILENITESLQNYDMLIHKEILSNNVEQTLVQIENSFFNYEKAFEAMYHSVIDSELMDIDSHTDVLNQLLKSNGLLPSDFEEKINYKFNEDDFLAL